MLNKDGLSRQDSVYLKSAIDTAAIVAITDKAGNITYANKKFCLISKYSAEELIGKNHRIINSGHHSKEFFTEMWKIISSGIVWEGEIRNKAKDGTYYWVHTTIVPFIDEQGNPIQYVAVRYDITERKLAEEQLKIYAKKLEISNRELQDFASIAAHDLQEPMRKIQSFSDRVQTKLKDTVSVEIMDYLTRIQTSAHRMQNLINDLLTYSRVTTKAQPFLKVNLDEIMTQVVSDLEVRIEQTGGQVLWKDLGTIEADPTQMHQLFQNLINNALKFHKPGVPPVVRVATKVTNIFSLDSSGPTCEVTIKDNSIGFDEKYLDRIFTIFQRLHGRHEYEGTGIGLAVCRKIVDRHGGSITAKSELGEGSIFIVNLPTQQKMEDQL